MNRNWTNWLKKYAKHLPEPKWLNLVQPKRRVTMGNTMNRKIVGKCGLCEGIVSVPVVFWSTIPPVPTCESCHASMDQAANLPTVPMVGQIPTKEVRKVIR